MGKEKILGYMEIGALTVVLISSAMWAVPGMRLAAGIVMAAGAAMLVVGRFLQTPFYAKYPHHDPKELTLRRLYHQRVFGAVGLIVATALMLTPQGFYFGMYVGPSSWMIPFVFFVVVEVYTAFRISAVDKS